ncbi:unnamed protein product [Paramecium sonneborni]|uniref:Uncharacterized protein n=1 Tax=Paramecium sonneborni TaxID=65129 RepID=A0A8S1R6Y6_9CILI|nr:unnamed protein product [Paramecium sonneborni]
MSHSQIQSDSEEFVQQNERGDINFYSGLFDINDEVVKKPEQIQTIKDKVIEQTKQSFSKQSTLNQKIKSKLNKVALKIRKQNEELNEMEEQVEEEQQKNEEQEQSLDPKIFAIDIEFHELKLNKALVLACHDQGYLHPTNVQAKIIPIILKGNDVLASSCTGSGKTAAFLLPIMQRFGNLKSQQYSKALIILPTRELALQCFEMFEKLNKYANCTAALVIGAVPIQQQEVELRKYPDIIIGTPGRIVDLLTNSSSIEIQNIEILVFDEADRLMEMGFENEIKQILLASPKDRQTVLISATLNATVKQLSLLALNNPTKINVDFVGGLAYGLKQYLLRIRSNQDRDREATLITLLKTKFKEKTIIFVKTKHDCHRLAIILGFLDMSSCELHGNLSQQQRIQAYEDFKEGKFQFLLATDLAARGLDMTDVKAVINYEIPFEVTRYIHRVGRTARIGAQGISVTICLENEVVKFKKMIRQSKQQLFKMIADTDKVKQIRRQIQLLEPQIRKVIKEEVAEMEVRKTEMLTQKGLLQNEDSQDNSTQPKTTQSKFQNKKSKKSFKKIDN